jgi:transposase
MNAHDVGVIVAKNQSLLDENQRLKERIAWFEKHVFGQKADRLPIRPLPESISLFANTIESAPVATTPPAKTIAAHSRAAAGHGRKPLPKHLERVEEVLAPVEAELSCTVCGCEKIKIGEDVIEILERRPDPFFVRRVIRPKFACKNHPEMGVTQAKPASRLVEKGNVGDSVVQHVILDKYLYHQPLTRQERKFKGLGIPIKPSTMHGWIDEFCLRAEAVVKCVRNRILDGCIAFSDDTSIPVLMKNKPGAAHRGAMWLYSNGRDAVVFEYSHGKSQKVPVDWLQGFEGYLHSDGYASYLAVHATGKVKPVYCFAHARRKFLDAFKAGDKMAARSLSLFRRLFLVDRYAKVNQIGMMEFKTIRNRVTSKILDTMFSHWIKTGLEVLPQSLLGKAIAYVLKRREGFRAVLKSPRLQLDNNLSERELRRVVVGRKNYMFCGSEEGAKRAAIIYSLIGTCELISLDPLVYFRWLMESLTRTPNIDPAALMPHRLQLALQRQQAF